MSARRLLVRAAPFAILLPALGFLLLQLAQNHGLGLPLDDAWIHAAYACSVAEGDPFRLHAGDEISPGSSAPLWTLLLAPLHLLLAALGVESHALAVTAALLLGLACAIAAAFAFERLLRALGLSPALRGALLFVFACTPRWVWGALSGLEVALYTALVLGALAAHVRAKAAGRSSSLALPLAALAGWSRPECFVLPALLVLDAWLLPVRASANGAGEPRAARAVSTRGLILGLAVAALYLGGHYALYGRPLPTTFYVKAEFASPSSALAAGELGLACSRALDQAGRQLLAAFAFFPAQIALLAPWILCGALAALRSRTRAGSVLVLYAVLFPLLQGAVKFHYPENQVGRYLWHLLVPYLALAALGLQSALAAARERSRCVPFLLGSAAIALASIAGLRELLAEVPDGALLATTRFVLWNDIDPQYLQASFGFYTRTSGALAALALGLALVGLLASATLSGSAQRRAAQLAISLAMIASPLSCIPLARLAARNVAETEAISVASARWLAEHAREDDLVALHDLGAIAYFARCRILDLQGIGSPRVLALPRGTDGRRVLAPLLIAEQPRFYAGFPDWHQQDLIAILPALREPLGAQHLRTSFQLSETVTLGGTFFVVLELPW
ncbi:MAG: hypothetical protein JNM84_03790 [Planctomycetes bacterium]|nr:hypothetical protein [Planctomycetota bacterium]